MAKRRKTGGRTKGTPNKVSGTVRQAILDAFHELGGKDGLIDWAEESAENKREFYRMCSKLIPREISGPESGPIQTEEVSMLDTARRIAYLLAVGEEEMNEAAEEKQHRAQ